MSRSVRNKTPNLDSVTTINRDGSKFVLHPADVRGRFTTGRRWFALLLLAIYIALPIIKVGNYPAVFFDVANGRFHLFGLTLITQDVWLLFFLITGLGFTLFFVTSLFGRLWCGWTCPYTVFLEHMFRRVERWIDGDHQARRKLDAAPWGPQKIFKRVLKHAIYLLMATGIAHLFLAYFVSLPKLYEFMQTSPSANAQVFGVVTFLSLVLYFCFAWFREQFCIILCPYGRIQSALTDDDTMVIGYDKRRGEPRGKKKKGSDTPVGDCIDCRRCVQVCPTGIDIRNGLQMECIGCAACVDACDEIMTKLKRPKGLVRYDSLNGMEGQKRRVLRPRVFIYIVLFCIGTFVMSLALTSLQPARLEAVRMRGMTFFHDETLVRNQFNVVITNKRDRESRYTLELQNAPEGMTASSEGEIFTVGALDDVEFSVVVTQTKEHYTGQADFELVLHEEGADTEYVRKIKFLGPDLGGTNADDLEKQREELKKKIEAEQNKR
ncbi:cytochrome c oxidase accessory protein CcoG [Sulfuriroseicoccus oceanibius]|uniref:Cytochrome c oxidase accessory protein CcoG n=1 Tax=Sulfuriroseicoccus oceanibius TaxID=2707525 RepID=A0A6B3L9Z4_9BACT|nr:cytochrome c oxidase accessory protein CcoG [Sulfuriroseicoccus oceanibius]QQL46082.1 cytochrome c oxidase accessory protein CcoG [Sulfuriroseicoccus oceanibius]